MLIRATFGVKSEDIDEAKSWVEENTGLMAEGRESSERGGDYYYFRSAAGEIIRIVSNRDIYDGEPITAASEKWAIALQIEETTRESPVLRALEANTSHYEKVMDGKG